MVGALATAETNNEWFVAGVGGGLPAVSHSVLTECPRHAFVEQSLQNLSLKHPDFELKWRSRSIVELSAVLFEARPGESDPSFDFRVDVGVFVDNAAQVDETIRLFALLVGSFDNERLDPVRAPGVVSETA